jgi:hypothetical protein
MSPLSKGRWLAIGIAIAAVWDPAMSMSRLHGPLVAITVSVAPSRALAAAQVQRQVERDLEQAGFDTSPNGAPDARVVVGDRAPRELTNDVPVWAVNMAQDAPPNVRIRRTSTDDVRVPGQAVEVRFVIDGVGVRGATTDVQLEQDGIPLATARHVWQTQEESWSTALRYLPPLEGAQTISLRAIALPTETTTADNTVAVRLPRMRSALRVLSYDASVSWPATFVRRSLEGEPAFSLSTLQRASEGVATRAGGPPDLFSEATLAPYDEVIVGGPEQLTSRQMAILRWFTDVRGGVVVWIADKRPTGGYASSLGVTRFDQRVVEPPVSLRTGADRLLRASELIIARHAPNSVRRLATVEPEGDAAVFAARSGEGAVVFFGALDAWRFRAADHEGFARFWRRTLMELGLTVAPRLSVEVEPSLARVGDPVRIRARLRGTELSGGDEAVMSGVSARAVGPAQHAEAPVRLWPTIEPGVFEGEWVVPAAGEYDISVSSGDSQADAVVAGSTDVPRGADADPEGLALLASASGGDMRSPAQAAGLVSVMRSKLPAHPTVVREHPMRSAWWMLPFVAAVCVDWGGRRMHGAR